MADEKEVVSMLDLQADTAELMGFNPEADANAALPVFPAGPYSVMVKFVEEDPDRRFTPAIWAAGTKNEQKVLYTNLIATIYNATDELINGRTLRAMVSTYTMRGTNSMQGVLQALGYGEQLRGGIKSRGQLALLLSEALQQESHAELLSDWEATEKLTDEERDAMKANGKKPWRKQGMTSFPKDGEGNYIPSVDYKGVPCKAYSVIDRWITAGAVETGQATPLQGQAAVKVPVSVPQPRSAMPQSPRPVQGAPVPRRAVIPGGAPSALPVGAGVGKK